MISQTEPATTTLSPATTTTTNNHTHHRTLLHDPSSNSDLLSKSNKTSNFNNVVKRRKKFDETIIDGFSVMAFKTWEDLQDELNERSSSTTNLNSLTNDNSNTCETTASSTADKKSKSKKNSSASASSTAASTTSFGNSNSSSTPTTTTKFNTSNSGTNSKKNKDKAKKSTSTPLQANTGKESKDKRQQIRNKFSSETKSLKRALEEKELAEKRLLILEEKLKQEQSKNRNFNADQNNDQIVPENHQFASQPLSQTHPNEQPHVTQTHVQVIKEEIHSNSGGNGFLRHDLLKDPMTTNSTNQATKSAPYSQYPINSQPQRQSTTAIHQQHHQSNQTNNNPTTPTREISQPSSHQTSQSKHHSHPITHHFQSQHSTSPQVVPPQPPPPQQQHSQTVPPQKQLLHQHGTIPPPVHLHQPQPNPPTSQSNPLHQNHNPYARQTPLTMPHGNPNLLQHQPQLPQPPLHPYASPVPSSMMSSMGLGSLPSPYGCPPSIYITDTISRQTSIIPPPPLVPSLEPSNPSMGASRFGHSTTALHSVTPYNPAVPPHHSMYYPTLPTERSFIEFARSYTGPGHLGYSSLMNSFPTSTPSITANPYNFDRWPRMAFDHQRAVSRYNSLYQSTTTIPTDRSYPTYTRPPFPPGLFVSI